MQVWANSNNDLYPLPSLIDINNDTVPELGTAKDTTANIFSLMLWNEMFTPDLLVSPAEPSEKIQVRNDYQYEKPPSAVNPDKAMWDPSFNIDFTTGTGHLSYAHAIPVDPTGAAASVWKNSFNATEPVISTRGPEILSENVTPSGLATLILANQKSNTIAYWKPRNTWSGNVAYNDGHAQFEQSMMMDNTQVPTLPIQRDWLFWDEPHDATQSNAFLSLFTTAGPTRSAFKAIWD